MHNAASAVPAYRDGLLYAALPNGYIRRFVVEAEEVFAGLAGLQEAAELSVASSMPWP